MHSMPFYPDLVRLAFLTVTTSLIISTKGQSQPIQNSEIKNHLDNYVREREHFTGWHFPNFIAVNRPSFYAPYLRPGIWRDIVEAEIRLKGLAAKGYGATCNNVLDDSALIALYLKGAFRAGGWPAVVRSMMSLQPNGGPTGTFCDFFSYLHCGSGDTCDCVTVPGVGGVGVPMVWDTRIGKCVFSLGQPCRDVSISGIMHAFWEFDYADQTGAITGSMTGNRPPPDIFLREGPRPLCVDGAHCDRITKHCDTVAESAFTTGAGIDIQTIVTTLKSHLSTASPTLSQAAITDLLRRTVKKALDDGAYRLVLTLEIYASQWLSTTTCDPGRDGAFEAILGTRYNPTDSPTDWLSVDAIREEYQKKLILDRILNVGQVCDHFRRLTCVGGQCECQTGLKWEGAECVIEGPAKCERDDLMTKTFKFQPNGDLYLRRHTECEGEFLCENLIGNEKFCVPAMEAPSSLALQARFENLLVLGLGDTCLPANEKAIMDSLATSFKDRRKDIQKAVDGNHRFCLLRNYQYCNPATGQCICGPGTTPNKDPTKKNCIASLYDNCDKQKTPIHLKLDVLQVTTQELWPSNVFCLSGFASCVSDAELGSVICKCNNQFIFGNDALGCNIPLTDHTAFIRVGHLHPELKSSAGIQEIVKFHYGFGKTRLGLHMVRKLDETCDLALSIVLEDIVGFVGELRECCKFEDDFVCSGTDCTSDAFNLAQFKIKSAKVDLLVPQASENLCHAGLICVSPPPAVPPAPPGPAVCKCPPNQFYTNGRCEGDIGMKCTNYRAPNDPFKPRCRVGTKCEGDVCMPDNSSGNSACRIDPTDPLFVEKTHECLVSEFNGLMDDVNGLRRKGNGNICDHVRENELQLALDTWRDAGDVANFNNDKLQHMREMEPARAELEGLNDVLYCKLETPCSVTREICTDGVDKWGQRKRATAAEVGASSYWIGIMTLVALIM